MAAIPPESWLEVPNVDALKCSTPWAEKVIYWPVSGHEFVIERLSGPRPRCDVSRPDWEIIWKEWKERKRRYIHLCQDHAVYRGFLW
jgi:hypothetical protein